MTQPNLLIKMGAIDIVFEFFSMGCLELEFRYSSYNILIDSSRIRGSSNFFEHKPFLGSTYE